MPYDPYEERDRFLAQFHGRTVGQRSPTAPAIPNITSNSPIAGPYYESQIAAIPEFAFPALRSERYYRQMLGSLDQEDIQALADAAFARGQIEMQYPRIVEKLRDAMAGRNIYFSGLTTKGEGLLAERKMFDIGGIERELSRILAANRARRALLGQQFSDTLEDALIRALSGETERSIGSFFGQV